MPFVPLPFVVALLLAVLLVRVWRHEGGDGDRSGHRAFTALIVVSIVQSVLAGLRWGYDVRAVMMIAPIGAAIVPPLAYIGATALMRRSRGPVLRRLAPHAGPALVTLLLLVSPGRAAIDLVLIATSLGYAVALLALLRPGADALSLAPFEGAAPAYRAILLAAFALLLSATIDAVVLLDLVWAQGTYVRPVIAMGNLALLLVLSSAAATASRSQAPSVTDAQSAQRDPASDMPARDGPAQAGPAEAEPVSDRLHDAETMAAIAALMQDKRAYPLWSHSPVRPA